MSYSLKVLYSGSTGNAAVLRAGEGSLNPEMLVTAMREKLGLLSRYPDSDSYSILRTNVYFENMKEFE